MHCVAISNDSKYIVSGGKDKKIILWERDTGNVIRVMEGHTDSIKAVKISSDVKYIYSGSEDCTIRIWNHKKKKSLLKVLTGHTKVVF